MNIEDYGLVFKVRPFGKKFVSLESLLHAYKNMNYVDIDLFINGKEVKYLYASIYDIKQNPILIVFNKDAYQDYIVSKDLEETLIRHLGTNPETDGNSVWYEL